MASAITPDTIGSRFLTKTYDHDPGANTAVLASPDGGTTPWYWDMQLYSAIRFIVAPRIVAAGGVTLVRAFASTDVLGATNATLISTSGTIALDDISTAGGDQYQFEVTAEQLRELDTSNVGLRYVTIEITNATNTDEDVVVAIARAVHPRLSLSATQQA